MSSGGSEAVRRCRVVVSGRVQGVGYRDACRREAERLGALGWVRNRSDGSVEAVLEGDAQSVSDLIAWLGIGPPQAVVIGITVEDVAPEGGSGFSILG